MRVIFMGTPDFAVGTLEALAAAGHEILLCVTQPDKPRGRGREVQATPVKAAAEQLNIPVFQPIRIREKEAVEILQKMGAEVIVVAAFGQMLPKEILEMPKYGCINVHASLLPRYRGAAPIQWAVINGETVTGVTIMKMDEGLDTGDSILTCEVFLEEDETGGSLFHKLAKEGADLCVRALSELERETAVFTPQIQSLATKTGLIQKQMGKIDWQDSAVRIERLIRGLNPWPSAYTTMNGKTLKIWRARAAEGGESQNAGKITEVSKDYMTVQAGNGRLELLEVQMEGKRRMSVEEFLRGYQVTCNTQLK